MNKPLGIPSRKERVTAEIVRRLSGEPPRNCIGCAYLYVVPMRALHTNWVGCAQDVAPPPLRYDIPHNCPAPWYHSPGYTYLNPRNGAIDLTRFPSIGKMAQNNAQKYFDFAGDRPKLRSEAGSAGSNS